MMRRLFTIHFENRDEGEHKIQCAHDGDDPQVRRIQNKKERGYDHRDMGPMEARLYAFFQVCTRKIETEQEE